MVVSFATIRIAAPLLIALRTSSSTFKRRARYPGSVSTSSSCTICCAQVRRLGGAMAAPFLVAPPTILESPPDGKTPAGRPGTGPGGQRPVFDRLRERGLVDLLRVGARRLLRA